MWRSSKQRGATALADVDPQPNKHLLAVGAACAAAGLGLALYTAKAPSEVSPAPQTLITSVQVQPSSEPEVLVAAVTPSADALAPASLDPAAHVPPEQPWEELTIKRGDNLSVLFKRAGFSDRELYRIVNGAEHGKALAKMFPGQTLAFQTSTEGELQALDFRVSALETVRYRLSDTDWQSERTLKDTETRLAWADGVITSSLFLAGQEAGLSQPLIMDMANIFGGVIDFVLDPRKGDTMHVLYEEEYLEGEKLRDGKIVAAAFTNQGETFEAYRYTDTSGESHYYSADGVSMRKAFLMAPVDFTRISSNFNMRRLHPIYKTVRPHRGTDYAAPTGTPVYAAGDGRVVEAGYTRANGNYIFIQHGEQYVTRYLHLNKRRVSKGKRVSQGQVIGTVGSTGAATGPHLHYEFLVSGVHRNPRTIHKQLPKAKSLPKAEMPRFIEAIGSTRTQLAALRSGNNLALNNTSGATAAP